MQIKNINRLVCIVTVFGVAQFLFLTFLAAYLYPGGYDYFGYFFSDLGATVAKNGDPNVISSLLFSVTLTVIALTLIPFWLTIHRLFAVSKIEKMLSKIGSALGLISLPFIIGIILFPMDTQLEAHFMASLIFVSLFALATILYSIAFILNKKYPSYIGAIGFILLVLSLVPFFGPTATYVAFLQKIAVYGYFLWVLLPTYILYLS